MSILGFMTEEWIKKRKEELAAFGWFLLKVFSLIGILAVAAIGVVGFAAETFFFAVAFISSLGGFPIELAEIISFIAAGCMLVAYTLSLGLELIRKGWDTPWHNKINLLINRIIDNTDTTEEDKIKKEKTLWWEWLIAGFFGLGSAAVIAAPCYLGYALAFASAPAAVIIAPAICFGILLAGFLIPKIAHYLKEKRIAAKENPLSWREGLSRRWISIKTELKKPEGKRRAFGMVVCLLGLVGFAGCNGYLGMGGLLLMLGVSSVSPLFIISVTLSILVLLVGYYMASQEPTEKILCKFAPEYQDKKLKAADRADHKLKSETIPKGYTGVSIIFIFTSVLNVVPAFLLAKVIVTSALGLALFSPGGFILALLIAAPIAFTYAMMNYYLSGQGAKENTAWLWLRYEKRNLDDANRDAQLQTLEENPTLGTPPPTNDPDPSTAFQPRRFSSSSSLHTDSHTEEKRPSEGQSSGDAPLINDSATPTGTENRACCIL